MNKLIIKNNIIRIGFIGDSNTRAKTNLVWALINEKPNINYKNKYGYDMEPTCGVAIDKKIIKTLNQTINIFFRFLWKENF